MRSLTALFLLPLLSLGCHPRVTAEKQLTFLALGDSYTSGESIQPDERWPVQLSAMLRSAGVPIAEPHIVARTGWTTAELLNGIGYERLDDQTFDMVGLLIGVNNQFRGRSLDEYRTQFVALLQQSITFARGRASHVIVLSIPDWSVMPFAEHYDRATIAKQIDEFNAVNREETQRAGARYVDVTPISRQATTQPNLIADDGLHPSAEQERRWAQLTLAEALAVLRRAPAPTTQTASATTQAQ